MDVVYRLSRSGLAIAYDFEICFVDKGICSNIPGAPYIKFF